MADRKPLTAVTIKNARADPARRVEIPDAGCPGPRLLVQPTGAKSWVMWFRTAKGDGASTMAKLTLGPVDLGQGEAEPKMGGPLTLSAARKIAGEINHRRASGVDVVAEWRALRGARRAERDEKAATRFGALAVQFVENYARPKQRRWVETARLLGLREAEGGMQPIPGGLAERWASRPVSDLGPRDVLTVLDECQHKSPPGLRRRRSSSTKSEGMRRAMFATLSKFFNWSAGRLVIDRNPCAKLDRPAVPRDRERSLSEAEIRAFWRACDAMGEPFGQALKLLLLTGQRLNEIAQMRAAEIGADRTTITFGPHRTKNRREHFIHLLPMARAVLKSIHQIAGCPYVFSTNGRTPISGFSRAKARLDALMERELGVALEPFRLHDLRRTCATIMSKEGIPPIVIEKALNHASGAAGGLVGTYQRNHYISERRAAFKAYEQRLADIFEQRESCNVVPIFNSATK